MQLVGRLYQNLLHMRNSSYLTTDIHSKNIDKPDIQHTVFEGKHGKGDHTTCKYKWQMLKHFCVSVIGPAINHPQLCEMVENGQHYHHVQYSLSAQTNYIYMSVGKNFVCLRFFHSVTDKKIESNKNIERWLKILILYRRWKSCNQLLDENIFFGLTMPQYIFLYIFVNKI